MVNLGPRPDAAAANKLFGNLTLLGFAGVITDLVRLAHGVGVPPTDAVALFKQFNPGEMLAARAAKIASGLYDPPSFTVEMAREDARLIVEEAARHDFRRRRPQGRLRAPWPGPTSGASEAQPRSNRAGESQPPPPSRNFFFPPVVC